MSSTLAEHLSYLKLPRRHDAYSQAIKCVLSGGETVADLGCGVGVLGIQCLQHGAAHVWGIDHSDAIEIARETVDREGFSDQYTCLRDATFRAKLPDRVDLIICDHVGFFGIDYGIIDMLEDAKARMLKPGGTVMPRCIALKIAAVSSEECHQLAHSWTKEPIPQEFAWLDQYSVNSIHPVKLKLEDLCATETALGEVRLDQRVDDTLLLSAKIIATRDVTINGLAGWFNCELAEGVWMTNSPIAAESIERPQAFFPFSNPIEAAKGDSFDVSFRIRHDKSIFAWTVTPCNGSPAQRMTNWKSLILTGKDLETRLDVPLALNAQGDARLKILSLVDGKRTAREIEALVLEQYPDLFASGAAITRFLRSELGDGADC
ncbi:class I SAM-dependent methyltransferase [Erythrobacter alti]|uniref:class I SAM-dependent methyltransferase n=1 Tax=Erythrobacter alti TaxID=1896145 RepID=UPI0030F3ADD4